MLSKEFTESADAFAAYSDDKGASQECLFYFTLFWLPPAIPLMLMHNN
jgi:hypothetical protein